MFLTRSNASLLSAALAVAFAGAWVCQGLAQGSEVLEVRELKAALKLAQDQLAAEQSRSAAVEEQRKALVGSLAEAVRVSEEQMISSRETQLKLQAFGVELFTQDDNSLEQRLLKAVRDLDIAQQEIERQSSAIGRLSEAFLKVLQTSPQLSEKQRAEADAAIAAAGTAIPSGGVETEGGADLSAARVVSIDSGVGLVVFSAGHRSGLRVGTPITVLRGERPLYSVMIVDVRETMSGAVLQDRMAGEGEVEIGDGIRLLAEQRTL